MSSGSKGVRKKAGHAAMPLEEQRGERLTALLHPASVLFALLGMVITLIAASLLYRAHKEALETRFAAGCDRIEELVRSRLELGRRTLSSAAAYVLAGELPRPVDWDRYVSALSREEAATGFVRMVFVPTGEDPSLSGPWGGGKENPVLSFPVNDGARFVGTIQGVIDPGVFFALPNSRGSSSVGLRAFDASDPTRQNVVHVSASFDGSAFFRELRQVEVPGGSWMLDLSGQRSFAELMPGFTALAVALSGMAITLFGVLILADSRTLEQSAARSLRAREREILVLNESLERKVERRTERLREANEELKAFSYSVSHDLRAPLRHVRSLAGIVRKEHQGRLPKAADADLARVDEAAGRMEDMIEGILSLAAASHAPLRRRRTDLSALAEEILDQIRIAYPSRNFESEVTPGLVAYVDPVMARTVLQNLLENAVKFTADREGAMIRVGAEESSEGPRYFVADNGIGFDGFKEERLFRLFKKMHRDSEGSGTGIGLALVKKAVSRHGGTIRAESTRGGGAVFRFSFGECSGENSVRAEDPVSKRQLAAT